MRLFDAIISANHRALDGDQSAGIHLADYASELPVVALTCVDPRLNKLFPGIMGLPPESFIWLRNAGNIITGPLSSTMRSLALACAVKGGREIAVIGHTDCQVRHTGVSELTERFRALGIERNQLPQNLTEYFGVFSSERQNVIQAAEIVRNSPLIGPRIPVQGLMVDTATGKLEWVVNGYDVLERTLAQAPAAVGMQMPEIGAIESFGDKIGKAASELKFPEVKIGELATGVAQKIEEKVSELKLAPSAPAQTPKPPPIPASHAARSLPVPPPIRMYPKR